MKQSEGQSIILKKIFERRSIRKYQPDPVPEAALETLLQAANWAPSAHNRQPWRFAVIRKDEIKNRLAKEMGESLRKDLERDGLSQDHIQKDVDRSYRRITTAPALILVSVSLVDMDKYPDEWRSANELTMAVQSASMAGQNLLLAAHALGLGACWMCAPLFCPDVVVKTLELPSHWKPQGLITIGYPAETRQKRRADFSERVVYLD